MMKIKLTLIIIAVSLILVLPSLQANVHVKYVQATGGCTSNDILHMTLVGIPPSINWNLLVTGSSQVPLLGIEYLSLIPFPFQNGTLAWSTSVSDWYIHNANFTQWSANIKPGLKWSNGQNVTSQDMLASYGPDMYFNSTYDYLNIEGEVSSVTAPNSSEVVFNLNAPDSQFLTRVSQIVGMAPWPASVINAYGKNAAGYSNLGTDIVNGPFYAVNYTSGSFSMTMLRNPYFQPQPQVCELDINFAETLGLTPTSILSGSSDLAPILARDANSVLANHNLGVLDEKAYQISTVQYNDTIYPYNMTSFRQALAYGINQSQIADQAFGGYASTAYNGQGIVAPNIGFWYNSNITKYEFNQTNSVALLSGIGITLGSDNQLHYSNGTVVSLTIWTDTDNPSDLIASSVVQQNLQTLGFNVNLKTTSYTNIVGDYYSNVGGIKDSMILTTSPVVEWGSGYSNVLPGWDVYWGAPVPSSYWLYPPSADAQYQSNLTAFEATSDISLQQQYAFRIQSLNSQYLPTLVLSYPDFVWAYSSQRWTNWPASISEWGFFLLPSAFAALTPVGTSTSTSASSSTSTATTTNTTSIAVSSTTTSTTTTAAGSDNTLLYAIIAVAVIVIALVGVVMIRRRG